MFTLRSPAQRQGVTPPPCVSPSPRKFHLPLLHFSSSPLFLKPRQGDLMPAVGPAPAPSPPS